MWKLVALILILTACTTDPGKNSELIVNGIQPTGMFSEVVGKYRYDILITHSSADMVLYSDSVYKLGDTLILVKK